MTEAKSAERLSARLPKPRPEAATRARLAATRARLAALAALCVSCLVTASADARSGGRHGDLTEIGGTAGESAVGGAIAGDLDARAAMRPPTASILSLDFDPRDGSTVIGINSSVPLTNHTIYESDANTIVVEIPDADITKLEPVAQVGTPQVDSIKVLSEKQGSQMLARFEIKRAPGARRSVALDPKNPRRLEVTVQSAASSGPSGAPQAATDPVLPAAPSRVLASQAGLRDAAPDVAVPPSPEARRPAVMAHRTAASPMPAAEVAAPEAVVAADAASMISAPRAPEPMPLSAPMAATALQSALAPGQLAPGQLNDQMNQRGPGKLTEASVERADDGRLVLKLTGNRGLSAQPFMLDDGAPRLVLDFPNTLNGVAFGSLPVRDAAVMRVRVAQNQPLPDPVTRIVIDLKDKVPYELVRGPNALLVAFGTPTAGSSPLQLASSSMTSTGMAQPQPASWALLGQPPAAGMSAQGQASDLLSTPVAPMSLSNLGRPELHDGSTPSPYSSGMGPAGDGLRETAGTVTPIQVGTPTPATTVQPARFAAVQVTNETKSYVGDPISISVKDGNLEDIFRLFHQVSGLNIIVDPSVQGKTITLELVDVPWDQALDLVLRTQGLGSSLDGNVLRIAPLTKLASEEQQKQALQTAQESAETLVSVAFPLSYAEGSAAEQIVRKSLSSRGDVVLDKRTNTLVVKDVQKRLDNIKSLVELLDTPTKQVMIEARIVETTLDFSKSVGIKWGFNYIADRAFGTSTGYSFPHSIGSDYAVNLPSQASNSIFNLSFRNILNTFALDLQLAALEDRGKARIISRPMVMVQNNKPAEIESGVQIPITNTTATEIQVSFVSASLRLSVTPQITADDNVIMDIHVENNAPVFVQAVGNNASIATRQARTVVAVPNGGTTVIGGIYQVNEGSSSQRVPFFDRIPLLGWLFRNKSIKQSNDELLIFVTPRIQKQ